MHVADVTMFYAPEGGGVRRYIEAKRAWLRARPGYAHSLVIPGADGAPAQADIHRVASLPLPLSHGYRLPLGRSAALRALLEIRPSLIEAGDPYHLAWSVLDAADRLRVPSVAFCHSDLPRVLAVRLGARAERLARRYYARLYRRFDLVLAPSRTMTARLRDWGITQTRHQPLGVDLEVFHPRARDARLREGLGLSPETRLVAFAGRLAPEKNLPVLIDAMKKLGVPYVALLIGAGSAPARLPDNVRLLPYIRDRAELAAVLASCDAFVHAGDQETFGLAVLEAMACGVPIVGTQAGGVAELVTREVGILVPPRDSDAFAAGIAEIFERDMTALGQAARRHAEGYDWARIVPQIVARYEALGARVNTASESSRLPEEKAAVLPARERGVG